MVTEQEAKSRLANARWIADPDLQALMTVLDGEERRIRAVGGAVRDTLLAIARGHADVDLATEFLPEEVVARVGRAGFTSYPTGIEHGTVTVKAGSLLAEITTLRQDVETDGRHAVVRFGTDWRHDASRRDFTLNALYADINGTLFDPLDGLSDCLANRIRFIGDADQRIAEDRLRVFRFFRFCASHGQQHFEAEGLAACARAAGTLGRLSAERVGAEMMRMLGLPKVAKTLSKMAEIGVIDAEDEAFSALAHYEDISEHPNALTRLTLLTLDDEGAVVQERWRLSNSVVRDVEEIKAASRLCLHGDFGEAAFRYPVMLAHGLAAAAAIGEWPREQLLQLLDEVKPAPPFPLSGADLMKHGIKPGPVLGRELQRLQGVWIESGFTLAGDELLAMVNVPQA